MAAAAPWWPPLRRPDAPSNGVSSNVWPVQSATAVDYVLLKNAPLYPVYAYRDSRTQLEKAVVAYIDYYYRRIKLKLNGLSPVQYRIQTVGAA